MNRIYTLAPFAITLLKKGKWACVSKRSLQYRLFSDAGATVSIVSSDYMVDESQSSVEVCANLTDIPAGGLECDVIATINTTDGPKASMS